MPVAATAQAPICTPTPAPSAPAAPASDPSCVTWTPGSVLTNATTLRTALLNNTCVLIPAGTYEFRERIRMPTGRTLKGAGRDSTTLLAVGTTQYPWLTNGKTGCSNIPTPETCSKEAMLADAASDGFIETSDTGNSFISDMTIDAGDRATLGLSISNTTVSRVTVRRATCDGITAANNVTITDSIIEDNGKYCLTGYGASGIYTQIASPQAPADGSTAKVFVTPSTYALQIKRNYIRNNWGGALDVNAVWGGVLADNIIECNRSKTSVSLFAASYWTITGNKIEHPSASGYSVTDNVHGYSIVRTFNDAGLKQQADGTYAENNDYYRHCSLIPGPSGVEKMTHSAGLVLCQAEPSRPEYTQTFEYNNQFRNRTVQETSLESNHNWIARNRIQGWHGLLSVGADCDIEKNASPPRSCTSSTREHWVPRFNTFYYNDVGGSAWGCLDDYQTGQSSAAGDNTWTNNNCAGPVDSPPTFF